MKRILLTLLNIVISYVSTAQLSAQDEIIVVPNQSEIHGTPIQPTGIDQNLGKFGRSCNVLPPQEGYDIAKELRESLNQPASFATKMQSTTFDWNEEADRATQSDYYKTEGFHPNSGTVPDPYNVDKEVSYTEQHYGQMQTPNNAMSKAMKSIENSEIGRVFSFSILVMVVITILSVLIRLKK